MSRWSVNSPRVCPLRARRRSRSKRRLGSARALKTASMCSATICNLLVACQGLINPTDGSSSSRKQQLLLRRQGPTRRGQLAAPPCAAMGAFVSAEKERVRLVRAESRNAEEQFAKSQRPVRPCPRKAVDPRPPRSHPRRDRLPEVVAHHT